MSLSSFLSFPLYFFAVGKKIFLFNVAVRQRAAHPTTYRGVRIPNNSSRPFERENCIGANNKKIFRYYLGV